MHLVEEQFCLGTCNFKTATGVPSLARYRWAVLQCLPLVWTIHIRLSLSHAISGSSIMRGLSSDSILSNPDPAFGLSRASCAVPPVNVVTSVGLPEDVRRIRQPRLGLTQCTCMPAHPAARAWIYPRACTDPAHLFHSCLSWLERRDFHPWGSPAVTHARAPQLPLPCECSAVCLGVLAWGGSKMIFGTRLR